MNGLTERTYTSMEKAIIVLVGIVVSVGGWWVQNLYREHSILQAQVNALSSVFTSKELFDRMVADVRDLKQLVEKNLDRADIQNRQLTDKLETIANLERELASGYNTRTAILNQIVANQNVIISRLESIKVRESADHPGVNRFQR